MKKTNNNLNITSIDGSLQTPKIFKFEHHPFHIVNPSPWPFIIAFSVLPIIIHFVLWLHGLTHCNLWNETYIGIIGFIGGLINWWYDIVIEGTIEGHHTLRVQRGLRLGMLLFIVSEVMFFFSFFWAFFHSAVSPSVAIGCVWPPVGIQPLNPWGLPFLNTIILISSGITVTWAHRCIAYRISLRDYKHTYFSRLVVLIKARIYGTNFVEINYYRRSALTALLMTISYGILFTLLQRYEYIHATFEINDGIYGSTFYMTTGFHGLHVIIGTTFLIVCFFRHFFYHFSNQHHVGLEAAIWYWHFVDIVWILVFASIYVWGS